MIRSKQSKLSTNIFISPPLLLHFLPHRSRYILPMRWVHRMLQKMGVAVARGREVRHWLGGEQQVEDISSWKCVQVRRTIAGRK